MKRLLFFFLALFLFSCTLPTEPPVPYVPVDLFYLSDWFSSHIAYESDLSQYGLPDYWATPQETLASMRGDCDDQAILFAWMAKKTLSLTPSILLLENPFRSLPGHVVVTFPDSPIYWLGTLEQCSWRVVKTYSLDEILRIASLTHGLIH